MNRHSEGLENQGLAEIMDVRQAARLVAVSPQTIQRAIRTGELVAFIPRGRDPARTGPGLGYRIQPRALIAWYWGT